MKERSKSTNFPNWTREKKIPNRSVGEGTTGPVCFLEEGDGGQQRLRNSTYLINLWLGPEHDPKLAVSLTMPQTTIRAQLW